jgi:hypothetical protein
MKKRVKVLMMSMLALSFLAIPGSQANAECKVIKYGTVHDVCIDGLRYMTGYNTVECTTWVYYPDYGYELEIDVDNVEFRHMVGSCSN